MTPEIHLRIAGLLLLGLAASHVVLPGRFNWKEELARLSVLNRQIFIVHTIFIVLVLVLMGVLALVLTDQLIQPSPLARSVLSGIVLFWSIRLVVQWFVYDSRLWKGIRLNTVIQYLVSLMWAYFCFAFGWALWNQFCTYTM